MAIQTWAGRVEANQEGPVNSGLNFRPGARVTIVSRGFAQNHPSSAMLGPVGTFGMHRADAPAPEENIGALLVKTGRMFAPVSGGLLNWSPPTDDNVEFLYNDRPGTYNDNAGGFDVTMEYDDAELMR